MTEQEHAPLATAHPSQPPQPREVEAIVARARRDAERFLRQEWRAGRREALFVGGGLFIVGVVMGGCVTPVFGLSAWHAALGSGVPVVLAMGLSAHRLKCPRCGRLPLSGALILQHRELLPPGCPHCGLPFEEPATESALRGGEL